MKLGFFLLIFLLLPCYVFAQQPLSIDNIPLRWSDFRTVTYTFGYGATISSKMSYDLKTFKANDGQFGFELSARLAIVPTKTLVNEQVLKSSTKSQLNELLRHEKGHYIISMIAYFKWLKTMEQFSFSLQFRKEIDSLQQLHLAEARQQQKWYDNATIHAEDKVQQAAWEEKLIAILRLYVPDKKHLLLKNKRKYYIKF